MKSRLTAQKTQRASGSVGPDRARSSAVERSVHIGEVAGSRPAAPTISLAGSLADTKTVERFWQKVDQRDPDECWPWLAAKDSSGYGKLRSPTGRRLIKASRFAYAVHYGDPGGLHILHRCDNPACCNPDHLFVGTHQDNLADMRRKGRARNSGPHGSINGRAKLNDGKVAIIRERIGRGETNIAIARDYGVHHGTISLIRRGKIWSDVTSLPVSHGGKI